MKCGFGQGFGVRTEAYQWRRDERSQHVNQRFDISHLSRHGIGLGRRIKIMIKITKLRVLSAACCIK